MDVRPILALMGPTASGKTQVALALAKQFPIEIVSVDSALVYRGLDIGSAKPTPAEQAQVKHHLIDIKDPSESYSAAGFVQDAVRCIQEIRARDKIPFLVGGTMLYFKALFEGLTSLPGACESTRQSICAEATQSGWPSLHAQLQAVDPKSAQRIHPNDQQRLVRAIEVYRQTGRSLTDLMLEQSSTSRLKGLAFKLFAIVPDDRIELHHNINCRFDVMMQSGLVEEVKLLFDRGDLTEDLPAIRSVGYRQVWAYLAGETTLDEMVERGKAASRQLAKRQLTWLRGWSIKGLPPYMSAATPDKMLDLVKAGLESV